MRYAIEGAPLQIFDKDGKVLGVLEVPPGAVYSLKYDNAFLEVLSELGKGVRVAATHKARNTGSKSYREIIVEYR